MFKFLYFNIIFLLLFLKLTSFSQTIDSSYLISYKVVYKKSQKVIVEDSCVLQTTGVKSIFFGTKIEELFKYITTKLAQNNKISIDGRDNNFILLKQYYPIKIFQQSNNTTFVIESIGDQYFGYEKSIEKFNWKLEPDTLIINNFLTQKASLSLDSSTVIAWFAPSIPINKGPLGFYNLPGLIVKIETSSGWTAELKNIQKTNRQFKTPEFVVSTKEEIKIIKKNYKQMTLTGGINGVSMQKVE